MLGSAVIGTTFPNSVRPYSGAWAAWLGGGANETSAISQRVTVQASAPYLSYWLWIASGDACGADAGGVAIDNGGAEPVVVDAYDLCTTTSTGSWVQRSVDLSPYIDQSVTLIIRASTDGDRNSNMFVDDVMLGSQAVATEE